MQQLIKLDYGSGHNPKKGFQTADIYGHPDFYIKDCQVLNLPDKSCKLVRMKNVFHHILNSEKLNQEMKRIIHNSGILIVIEPSNENYESCKFLDRLWYRGIIYRPKIVWSDVYRDPRIHFSDFKLINYKYNKPYEIFIFAPRY